jgi:hypothetical protein
MLSILKNECMTFFSIKLFTGLQIIDCLELYVFLLAIAFISIETCVPPPIRNSSLFYRFRFAILDFSSNVSNNLKS